MKKLIIIITLFIMQLNFVSANTNIAVIDMDKIVNTTKTGTSILNQLNKIYDEILIDLKKQEEKLKDKEIKLISQKNILSKSDFDINIKNFKVEIEKYNENRKKTITNFNIKKEKNINRFLQMAKKILAEYSNSKSISMVFQKKDLVIARTSMETSKQVMIFTGIILTLIIRAINNKSSKREAKMEEGVMIRNKLIPIITQVIRQKRIFMNKHVLFCTF